jgi:hypothetical protein
MYNQYLSYIVKKIINKKARTSFREMRLLDTFTRFPGAQARTSIE